MPFAWDTDDHNVDVDSAQDFDRFEPIVGAQHPMAGLTQHLIDQLEYGCVCLEDEDRRGNGWSHTTRLPADERQRQTQMGRTGMLRRPCAS